MEIIGKILLVVILFALCLSVNKHNIIYGNQIIETEKQNKTIDSLKVELIRLDSTLVSWDVEYQQNLEESNGLIQELNDNLK